jgi:hypothetical protein
MASEQNQVFFLVFQITSPGITNEVNECLKTTIAMKIVYQAADFIDQIFLFFTYVTTL